MLRKIFVVGNSRSGTSMTARLLGLHSRIHTFGELHFFEQLWKPAVSAEAIGVDEARWLAARLLGVERDGYLNAPDARKYLDEAKAVLNEDSSTFTAPEVLDRFFRYETMRVGKHLCCEQTPRNVYYLKEILAHYPDARIVNIVRDPRDVLLSQQKRWRRRFLGAKDTLLRHTIRAWLNYHPYTASVLWRSGVAAADRFSKDSRVFQVRFEDFVADPEGVARALCSFVDVEFERQMLLVPRKESSIDFDRPERPGIDASVVGRWRSAGLKSGEIYICQRVTREGMRAHGYEPVAERLSVLGFVGYAALFLLKTPLAFLVNSVRHRRVLSALRRRIAS